MKVDRKQKEKAIDTFEDQRRGFKIKNMSEEDRKQ